MSRQTSVTGPASLAYGNGTTISYAYEPDSALDQLTNDVAGAAQDVAFGFDYNRVNQILTRTLSNPLYRWDGHRNQVRSYAHNGLNQVTQVGLQALSHDANGNLTGDGTWSYGYDAENRLIAASKAGVDAAYGYDGLGRRTSKTVNGSSTHYLHDGDALIAEYAGASGDSPLRRYAHGPGVDEPIVVYDGAGMTVKRWLYRNWQGSIVAEAYASGVVDSGDIYTYGPYGEPNTTGGPLFRYTGQILDAETGLYYYKARYYSPALGRFLQTDPIGYEDQMNLYAYVGNDPVNSTDPDGKNALAIARGALTFIAADAAVPEPTDVAAPKWVAYAVVGAVAGVVVLTADEKAKPPTEKKPREQRSGRYPTRKAAKDARPRPSPQKPKAEGGKRTTRQTKNQDGTGNKPDRHQDERGPHFHDRNHNDKAKPNDHYRFPK